MQLKDIMNRRVVTVAPGTPLYQAAHRMSMLKLRMLPVCDGDKVVGLLTLRDLAMRATAQGRDPATSKVRDVMNREFNYCYETQDAREAAGIMQGHHLWQLLVFDHQERLVGTVSRLELQRRLRSEQLMPKGRGEPMPHAASDAKAVLSKSG